MASPVASTGALRYVQAIMPALSGHMPGQGSEMAALFTRLEPRKFLFHADAHMNTAPALRSIYQVFQQKIYLVLNKINPWISNPTIVTLMKSESESPNVTTMAGQL